MGIRETLKVAHPKFPHIDVNGVSNELDTVFSSATLYSCVPHAEELVVLVSRLSNSNVSSMRSPGVSRKFRPSTLSPFGDIAKVFKLSMNGHAFDQDPVANTEISLISKLRERFFHQHPDLKELCEFAVKKSLQKFSTDAFEKHLLASINAKSCSNGNSKRQVLVHQCRELMRQDLEVTTNKILATLAVQGVDESVTKIAVSIAVEQGIVQASQAVQKIASKQALLLANDEEVTAERKQLFASEEVVSHDCSDLELALRNIVVSVLSLVDSFPCLDQETIYNILPNLKNLFPSLRSCRCTSTKQKSPQRSRCGYSFYLF